MMEYSSAPRDQDRAIAAVFQDAFSAAEGPEEGAVVGALARSLLQMTDAKDLFAYAARDGDAFTGCIIFSRLRFPDDDRQAFILSPVAVAPSRQGQGIGQNLITYGRDQLRAAGIDIAITYGDPNYYAKVGFRQITTAVAAAPLPLSQPEGWLGQSLTAAPLTPLKGPSSCVVALNDPTYW